MQIVDRKTKKEYVLKYDKKVLFLYQNVLGRILLKLICNRFVANLVAKYMNSSLSIKRINKTIRENNINMDLFVTENWHSFNHFFTRQKKNIHILFPY